MSFVIIPDTACDLEKNLRDRFGIEDYLRSTIRTDTANLSHLTGKR